MYSFYQLLPISRMASQFVLFVGITAQIANLVLFYFRRSEKNLLFRILFEVGIAYHYFVMNLSIGLIQMNVTYNLLVDPYPLLRNLTLLVPLLGVPVLMYEHKNTDLIAIISLILSLPFMEQLLASQYATVLFFLTLILFIRSLVLLRFSLDHVLNKLSRFSMKEAFDSFPEGLAIGRKNGRVILINKPMRTLMDNKGIHLSDGGSALSRDFRRLAARHPKKTQEIWGASPAALSAKLLSFEAEGKVYRYTDESFRIGKKDYEQILATDISEENRLIRELDQKNAALAEGNHQLEILLQNIEEIEKEKEAIRMRNRIHDVMGQRLSILHSYLQQMDRRKNMPLEELLPLLEDMMKDLREPEHKDSGLSLDSIRNAAELVGTQLLAEGALPTDEDAAAIMLRILREAVTNAIRHGQARKVRVLFREEEERWLMEIENDGTVPRQDLTEREGIRGMRRQLEEIGGELLIRRSRKFSMLIHIPKNKIS